MKITLESELKKLKELGFLTNISVTEIPQLSQEKFHYDLSKTFSGVNFEIYQLASLDESKILRHNTEDVIKGENTYKSFLEKLNNISEGRFSIRNVEEKWTKKASITDENFNQDDPDNYDISVRFYLDDKEYSLTPNSYAKYFDVEYVIEKINSFLDEKEEKRLFVLEIDGAYFYTLFLSLEEVNKLKQAGWRFDKQIVTKSLSDNKNIAAGEIKFTEIQKPKRVNYFYLIWAIAFLIITILYYFIRH